MNKMVRFLTGVCILGILISTAVSATCPSMPCIDAAVTPLPTMDPAALGEQAGRLGGEMQGVVMEQAMEQAEKKLLSSIKGTGIVPGADADVAFSSSSAVTGDMDELVRPSKQLVTMK